MVPEKKEALYASQVILRDPLGVLYLEKNSHLGKISFWGGTKEPGDGDEFETALRELREELGIIFKREDLKIIDIDKPREFPKGIFISTLFLIDINDTIAQEVRKNTKMITFTLEQIKDSSESFVLGKENFLKRISKITEQ